MQAVVFNANYLTYMDEAITGLWRLVLPGGYAEMVRSGIDLLVGEANVRYLAPARFDDELEIEVRVVRLGTTGMTSELTIRREREAITEGRLRHVFVTAGAGEKTPIPESVRKALTPYVSESSKR